MPDLLPPAPPDPELAAVPAEPGPSAPHWYIDRDTELDDRPLAGYSDGVTLDEQMREIDAILARGDVEPIQPPES